MIRSGWLDNICVVSCDGEDDGGMNVMGWRVWCISGVMWESGWHRWYEYHELCWWRGWNICNHYTKWKLPGDRHKCVKMGSNPVRKPPKEPVNCLQWQHDLIVLHCRDKTWFLPHFQYLIEQLILIVLEIDRRTIRWQQFCSIRRNWPNTLRKFCDLSHLQLPFYQTAANVTRTGPKAEDEHARSRLPKISWPMYFSC